MEEVWWQVLLDCHNRELWDPVMTQFRVLDYMSDLQQVVYSATSAVQQDCVHLRTCLRRTVMSRNPRNLAHVVVLQDSEYPSVEGHTRCKTNLSGFILSESVDDCKDCVMVRIVEAAAPEDQPGSAENTFRTVFPKWAEAYHLSLIHI
eukprot:TRINITY_DN2386_c0_g1_i4.p2 TRINITY_DN2386_c0_g1~~TRINITY_DN2386_c0_g1_i4.p2  ORF type:complete len:148 (-),score=24.72 TRINITY_DN2386_c0_g1_i4:93-536(-)